MTFTRNGATLKVRIVGTPHGFRDCDNCRKALPDDQLFRMPPKSGFDTFPRCRDCLVRVAELWRIKVVFPNERKRKGENATSS